MTPTTWPGGRPLDAGGQRRASRTVLPGPIVVALVVLGAAGCGTTPPAADAEVPVVAAEPVPFAESPLAPPTAPVTATPVPGPTTPLAPPVDPASSPSPTATQVGPTSAAAAAFVRSDAFADLTGLEHVVVDLDGDTWPEVVATGVRERVGRVRVAWWTTDGYRVMASDDAGPGRDVTDLRAADLNRDGRTEVLVVVEGEGRRSLALWAVAGHGTLDRLVAVGGCHDGSHVYGVTSARLEDRGEAPPAIVADCDDSPLPVVDWAEQRWEWQGGAYRLEEAAPDPTTSPSDPPPDE